jgi:hypothetical protein
MSLLQVEQEDLHQGNLHGAAKDNETKMKVHIYKCIKRIELD